LRKITWNAVAAATGSAIGLGVEQGCLGDVNTPATAYEVLLDSGKFSSYLSFALRFGELLNVRSDALWRQISKQLTYPRPPK
jgi:hypothetical protein